MSASNTQGNREGRQREETSGASEIQHIERFEFYDRAREAFAIVATGEKALYANIILKKGVVSGT